MNKFKKQISRVISLLGASVFLLSACADSGKDYVNTLTQEKSDTYATKLNGSFDTKVEEHFDENVVYKLSDSVAMNTDISVIVTMNTESIVDSYLKTESERSVSEYVTTQKAKAVAREIEKKSDKLIKKLDNSGVKYTLGERYDTVLSGFEITIKAKDFDKVGELFKNDATLVVGEIYEPAITKPVTNTVVVDESTGIFKGLDDYKGDGVVVAVLDTGLDYTHTAFLPENFPTLGKNEDYPLAFELDSKFSAKVSETVAATLTDGLTANDVYLNVKVPFMYDYADKDPDVMPINSEHGTHVAGIISGQDDTIVGVAPNAQLAIMKVFSDTQTGAKTSWILGALEDCVNLGVDVINMSLGSGCGFAREDDDEVSTTYDKLSILSEIV